VDSHEVTEVKTIGDAVMLHTDDAATAVDVATRIVRDVGSRHHFPTVRVGVHTGPAVERDGDWFGAAVNLASRVADSAEERDVLVTVATRDAAAASLPELDFMPAGPRRFKNVAQPVDVFRVVTADHAVDTALPTDPVCRMVVDPDRTTITADHHGRTHHFCSEHCRDAFTSRPELYSAVPHGRRLQLLVSDEARERAVRRVGRAYARGRLSQDELETRVAHAYSARTRADLTEATRGLPRKRSRRPRWWWVFTPWRWIGRRRRRRRRR
jgi:YHS domain-containing protein